MLLGVSAQAWNSPAATRSKLSPPDTAFGTRLELWVPLPSSPLELNPQQKARFSVVYKRLDFNFLMVPSYPCSVMWFLGVLECRRASLAHGIDVVVD